MGPALVALVLGTLARAEPVADSTAVEPETGTSSSDEPLDPATPTSGEAPEEAELPTRRERARALRQARWEGPRLPEEADFLQHHVDVRLRLSFNGTSPGPFSLLTAFAGWNELGVVVDAGVASWRGFTLGLGGSAEVGYGLVLGLISGRIANYDEFEFGWRMWDASGMFRATAHYNRLSSVDPYLLAGVGLGAFHLDAQVRNWPEVARQGYTVGYARIELGGGLTWRLPLAPRWTIGGELRYLLSASFDPRDRFLFERSDGTRAAFTFAPLHRPPKGFSLAVLFGYRF